MSGVPCNKRLYHLYKSKLSGTLGIEPEVKRKVYPHIDAILKYESTQVKVFHWHM